MQFFLGWSFVRDTDSTKTLYEILELHTEVNVPGSLSKGPCDSIYVVLYFDFIFVPDIKYSNNLLGFEETKQKALVVVQRPACLSV